MNTFGYWEASVFVLPGNPLLILQVSYSTMYIIMNCILDSVHFIIITVGPKLAANWFPPKQRTTATALAQGKSTSR